MDYDTILSNENLDRVSNVMSSMMVESDILNHKVALVESCVVSINHETGYGESFRVIDLE